MKIALGAKNKLCFIDGTYTPPSSNSPLYGGWKKADRVIFLLAIELHLQGYFIILYLRKLNPRFMVRG